MGKIFEKEITKIRMQSKKVKIDETDDSEKGQ